MESSITYEHGDTTCAVVPGKFCYWIAAKRFGTNPWCRLYDTTLYENAAGWLSRCAACMVDNPPDPTPEKPDAT